MNLIKISWNAHHGFLMLARFLESEEPDVAFNLRVQAETRRHQARLLQKRVRDMGEEAMKPIPLSEPLCNGWNNVVDRLRDRSRESILNACFQCELGAFKAYCQVMETKFDPATEWILNKQRKQIETSIHELQNVFIA